MKIENDARTRIHSGYLRITQSLSVFLGHSTQKVQGLRLVSDEDYIISERLKKEYYALSSAAVLKKMHILIITYTNRPFITAD